MKRFFLIVSIAIASMVVKTTYACDACSSGGGSQYIGLLPAFTRNFVGIQYVRNDFSGTFPSAYLGKPPEHTHDIYNAMQVWGRHRIGNFYQVFAFVPYRFNVRAQSNGKLTGQGIGDVTLLLNRVLINKTTSAYSHSTFGGFGVKLPTGKFSNPLNADNTTQSQTMQPGTGSLDFVANANYTIRHGDIGLNTDVSFILTTPAAQGYKYGNKTTAGAMLFYTFHPQTLTITPQIGARAEYGQKDYYSYSRSWLNEYSGGELLFGAIGLQIAYKAIGARLTGMLPLSQQYAGGQQVANSKTELGVFFLF